MLNCKDPQKIYSIIFPQDIADFLQGEESVIYFSLGSVAKSERMPSKYLDILVSAFAKIPYKVIWKFETERKDIPKNVFMKKWMPQQDVLGKLGNGSINLEKFFCINEPFFSSE